LKGHVLVGAPDLVVNDLGSEGRELGEGHPPQGPGRDRAAAIGARGLREGRGDRRHASEPDLAEERLRLASFRRAEGVRRGEEREDGAGVADLRQDLHAQLALLGRASLEDRQDLRYQADESGVASLRIEASVSSRTSFEGSRR